jgi:hypothetical protein
MASHAGARANVEHRQVRQVERLQRCQAEPLWCAWCPVPKPIEGVNKTRG